MLEKYLFSNSNQGITRYKMLNIYCRP